MTNDIIKVENNPWEVKSIYEYYYFNCPSCTYKHSTKQDFFDHILQFHPESSDHLRKISDGSLSDIITPWEDTVSLPNQNLLRKCKQIANNTQRAQNGKNSTKGPSINDITYFLIFLTPPSPLSLI